MVGYDSRKIAQNRTGVKRGFSFLFGTIFQTQDCKEPQYLGGGPDLSKLAIACQYPQFGKISEMKSISKPPLPIEIYTI
jgi:hypothetical protein